MVGCRWRPLTRVRRFCATATAGRAEWVQATAGGRTYWYNPATQETAWHNPTEEWIRADHTPPYWYHRTTHETRWEKPEEAAPAAGPVPFPPPPPTHPAEAVRPAAEAPLRPAGAEAAAAAEAADAAAAAAEALRPAEVAPTEAAEAAEAAAAEAAAAEAAAAEAAAAEALRPPARAPPRPAAVTLRAPPLAKRRARPKRVDETPQVLQDMRMLCIRSSSVRVRLKLVICESADEQVISRIDAFFNFAQRRAELTALADEAARADGDTEALADLAVTAIAVWFYAECAPHVKDLCSPWLWYPKAHLMPKRRFIFHAGPTNSGKTYSALQAVKSARSAVYCAPLKMLAAQVCSELNDAGKPCDLVIGDEVVFHGRGEVVSCTVEMCPCDEHVDVGVVDEVQMIADPSRGWAWCRAVLGLPAREIHLCGEARAVPVVRKLLLAAGVKSELTVEHHSRLVPLAVTDPLGGDIRRLEGGDCLVCFSRRQVHETAQRVRERHATATVCVVYGALPHAVRQSQAALFNRAAARGDFAVLVATDAIALGLNLNIRRVVFSAVEKFSGAKTQPLSDAHILQIGGRAGRAGCSFAGEGGMVTTLHNKDFQTVQRAFDAGPGPDLEQVGVMPTIDTIACFWHLHSEAESFHSLLKLFLEEVETHGLFFPCDMVRQMLPIAEQLSGLDIPMLEAAAMSFLPWSDFSDEGKSMLRGWFAAHAAGRRVPVSASTSVSPARLEQQSKWLECYCWLAMRYPYTFSCYDEARALRDEMASEIAVRLNCEVEAACAAGGGGANEKKERARGGGGRNRSVPGPAAVRADPSRGAAEGRQRRRVVPACVIR
eukprot:TRINITY_DN8002_c0_g1_i3.p1 TRINITY_DN8002_c0_g1~~TRINITY_DN8002_c0_g1_i3.p1  ORF type:complete len:832 (+),score=249.21 TRINITY_DN8002_c0_g1_i3:64-2559(+)